MDIEVRGNTPVAIDFLLRWAPNRPRVLTAMAVETRAIDTATFQPGEEDAMAAWIDARQGVLNIYFHPALLMRAFTGSGRPSKADVRSVGAAWADYDPPNTPPGYEPSEHAAQHRAKTRKALKHYRLPPSLVIRSGGGIQSWWLYAQEFQIDGDERRAKEVEKVNIYLKDAFKDQGIKGDSVQSVEHLMRLPGTVNVPDAAKLKKGRVPYTAEILEEHWDRVYSPSDFLAGSSPKKPSGPGPSSPPSGPGPSSPPSGGNGEREIMMINDLGELDQYGLDARLKAIILCGPLKGVPKKGDNTRSGVVCDVCRNLPRLGVPPGIIAGLLINPKFGVSESVLERRSIAGAIEEAWRQVDKGIAAVADEKSSPTEGRKPAEEEKTTPTQYAQIMLAARGRKLLRFNGEWLSYERGAYQAREDEGIRAEIWKGHKKATLRFVNNVLAAANAQCHRDKNEITAPCWLDSRTEPATGGLLVLRNGILDLPTNTLLPHTEQLFTRNALAFDFDRDAPKPERWLRFLSEVWPDDPESITALQMMFGYLLVIDASQQKIFVLVGPPRCGKGTVGRVLSKLLGTANICAPTFTTLSSQFGQQGMIGKQLALISDMRIGKMTDRAAVAETLLRISGEDPVSIPRKNRDDWDGQLKVRFVIMSNEPPTLDDPSRALLARYIVLQMRESFLGREDRSLDGQLEAELPGILNWALDGWRALRDSGRLLQPASAADLIESISRTSSPVSAFVTDACVVDPDAVVDKNTLYLAFKEWCRGEDRVWSSNKEVFSKTLTTAFPGIKSSKVREGGDRKPVYRGIALREPQPFRRDELDLEPPPF